eukprot:scaffold998_cov162-Ochromonas_danica.AAC.11
MTPSPGQAGVLEFRSELSKNYSMKAVIFLTNLNSEAVSATCYCIALWGSLSGPRHLMEER